MEFISEALINKGIDAVLKNSQELIITNENFSNAAVKFDKTNKAIDSFFKDNNHKITLELIQLLTDNLSGARDQLLDMAYSSVNKKTASTILKFAAKLNNKSGEAIRISRNDLASVAGIATETLIRTLSSFKKDGLIEIEARNIKILDIEKLQQIN